MSNALSALYRPVDSHPALFTQNAYLPHAAGKEVMRAQMNQAAGSLPPTHVMHYLITLASKDFARLSDLSLGERAKIYVSGAAEARGILAEAFPSQTSAKIQKLKEEIGELNAQLAELKELRIKLQAQTASRTQTHAQHLNDLKVLQQKLASIQLKQKNVQAIREQLEKERKDCKRAFNDTKQAGK